VNRLSLEKKFTTYKNTFVALLLLKFEGHFVRRTCADCSFQLVSNLAVEYALMQLTNSDIGVNGRALILFLIFLSGIERQKAVLFQ